MPTARNRDRLSVRVVDGICGSRVAVTWLADPARIDNESLSGSESEDIPRVGLDHTYLALYVSEDSRYVGRPAK